MPTDLDPLTWDYFARNWIQAGLFLCVVLCMLATLFMLDPLLPNLEKPGMSKRKALECVALVVFLAAATAVVVAGTCIGLRLSYGYRHGLINAPAYTRRVGFGWAIGQVLMLFIMYYRVWIKLRMPKLMEKI